MVTNSQLSAGDAFLLSAMFLWLTFGVGPVWLGGVVFFAAMAINLLVYKKW